MGAPTDKTFAFGKTVCLVVLLLGTLAAGCLQTPVDPAEAALGYLEDQDLHGGVAIQALQATAGRTDPAAWPPGDPLLDHIQVPDRYGDRLRLADGLLLHGLDPRDFQGTDLVEAVRDGHDGQQFGASPSLVDDAWAVDVLARTGHRDDPDVQDAVARLQQAQAPDGGWSWDGGPEGDTDVTAWVLEALGRAGSLDPVRADAQRFLAEGRRDDGASSSLGVGHNCQSTALALHAHDVLALDRPADSEAYVLSCQRPDGGFAHRPDGDRSDLWATLDILPVLDGTAPS